MLCGLPNLRRVEVSIWRRPLHREGLLRVPMQEKGQWQYCISHEWAGGSFQDSHSTDSRVIAKSWSLGLGSSCKGVLSSDSWHSSLPIVSLQGNPKPTYTAESTISISLSLSVSVSHALLNNNTMKYRCILESLCQLMIWARRWLGNS